MKPYWLLFVLTACKGAATTDAPAVSSAQAPTTSDHAEIGKPAPDFTLNDLDGKPTSLKDFKGKLVVLEWFNPGCPFVNRSHEKGSLKGLAAKYTATGVVWLAINSGAEGKQGFGVAANKAGAAKLGMTHPILLDPTGKTGHAYGATNTPHMFVIDAAGIVRYMGAIDNSPDAEGESPSGGTLINYVDDAITAIRHDKTPVTAQTKAYGCSVKY